MIKLKIAIIGTRGIPNHYGGFEQFAEYLAKGLVEKGHSITVYNSHTHPYKKSSWNGVNIIHKFDPEDKIGTIGQFVYDFNCIRSLKNYDFDIVLQLGYTSNSVWNRFLPSKPVTVTNMDGLEWKRTKYNKLTQSFLKYAEKLGAYSSDYLISDSVGIKNHLLDTYKLESTFIPYGANSFNEPDKKYIEEYDLNPFGYNLLIARMEPENNVEEVIKGHLTSKVKNKLILIGGVSNSFGKYLKDKYENDSIRFIGAVYDHKKLNNLRFFSTLYFHGHSVGGTNPSLLEAMASNSLICAHDNVFNKAILEIDAFYFRTASDIAELLNSKTDKAKQTLLLNNNQKKIYSKYSWESVINQYESLFIKVLDKKETNL